MKRRKEMNDEDALDETQKTALKLMESVEDVSPEFIGSGLALAMASFLWALVDDTPDPEDAAAKGLHAINADTLSFLEEFSRNAKH